MRRLGSSTRRSAEFPTPQHHPVSSSGPVPTRSPLPRFPNRTHRPGKLSHPARHVRSFGERTNGWSQSDPWTTLRRSKAAGHFLKLDVASAEVVHNSIAGDIVRGIPFRNVPSFPPDDAGKL